MSYIPKPALLGSIDEFWRYLQAELKSIGQAIGRKEPEAREYHEAPRNPKQGLLVIADGTDWDPGSGRGLYINDNGTWTLVVTL